MKKEGLAELLDSEKKEIEEAVEFYQSQNLRRIDEIVAEAEILPETAEINDFNYTSEIRSGEYQESVEQGSYEHNYNFEEKENDKNNYTAATETAEEEARELYEDDTKKKVMQHMFNLSAPLVSGTLEEQEKIRNYGLAIGAWRFVLYDIERAKQL